MIEWKLLLARVLAFAFIAKIAVERERLTGDVPNVLTLAGLVAGFGLAYRFSYVVPSLIAFVILALPTLWAFSRYWVDATVVRLTLAVGALLSPAAAGVTLLLGMLWVRALHQQQARWRQASRTPPRLASSPRVVALTVMGGLAGVGASFVD